MKNLIGSLSFVSLVFTLSLNAVGQNRVGVAAFESGLLKSNTQLVDVRTPGEFSKGHLKGAINIDWNGKDFNDGVANLNKTKPVYVYCLSGGRSSSAARRLNKLGFEKIYDLKGGVIAWQNAEKPMTESASGSKPKGTTRKMYDEMVGQNIPVLVDFYAPWCGPCKKMAPMLQKLAEAHNRQFKLIKLNADNEKELMKSLGIVEIPALMIYRNGKIDWQHIGLATEGELEKQLGLISKN